MHKSRSSLIFSATLLSVLVSPSLMADVIQSGKVKFGTSSYNADWYLPTAQPSGLVYLQHGFQRDKKRLKDLGSSLMSKGLMVLAVNVGVTGGGSGVAPNVANAFVQNQLTPPNGYLMPPNVVLAGHSAGGLHVTLVGRELVNRGYSALKGVILFDPVDANNRFASAAQAIVNQGLPLLAITANPGSCNSNNNTEPALKGLVGPSYVGFKLINRSAHFDAEGTSSDWLGRTLCGASQAANIEALKTTAGAWALDLVNNTITPDYYPGGAYLQNLLSGNQAKLIKQ